jgi:2-keto-3-deoxy-L-rhamnonate aldolase RhmA
MKARYLAAAMCVALPVVAGVALAQQSGGSGQVQGIGTAGDGVQAPTSGFPLAAPAGRDSGAISKAPAGATNTGRFNPATWKYGTRYNVEGGVKVWSPVRRKMMNKEKVYSATISGAATPEAYCTAAANPVYDFIWTEMQHSPGTWQNVAAMWNTCPGSSLVNPASKSHAMAGARISQTTEFDIQHATDMGAMVVVVPTMDTVAEAREAVNWTYFPPMGRRSAGGNVAGQPVWWGQAPGGYRATYNDNITLILMIETLEGIANADAIAKVPGVIGLFAASSDLGNFTGYSQGDPDYERVINIVHDATIKANIRLCGPSSWNDRPDFTCYQGGPPGEGGRGRGGRGRGGRGAQ